MGSYGNTQSSRDQAAVATTALETTTTTTSQLSVSGAKGPLITFEGHFVLKVNPVSTDMVQLRRRNLRAWRMDPTARTFPHPSY